MNKVIRTARISDKPVVLPVRLSQDASLQFEAAEETFSEEDFEAAQAQDVEESEAFDDLVNQTEIVDEEPRLSMEEVEALIAEKLQEAEARFLAEKEQEKEAAHQAGMEAGHAKGYAEGETAGHAAGLAEGQAQSQDEIARFQAMVHHMAERWDRLFKSVDMDLTRLALAVAKNVVGSVTESQEDLVLASVRECLGYMQDVTRLTICVNPDDLAIVRAHRTQWQSAYERIESMVIEADETIERGGCVIETPSGDIDGQISSRLDKLRSAILERLQGASAETPPDVSDVVAEPVADASEEVPGVENTAVESLDMLSEAEDVEVSEPVPEEALESTLEGLGDVADVEVSEGTTEDVSETEALEDLRHSSDVANEDGLEDGSEMDDAVIEDLPMPDLMDSVSETPEANVEEDVPQEQDALDDRAEDGDLNMQADVIGEDVDAQADGTLDVDNDLLNEMEIPAEGDVEHTDALSLDDNEKPDGDANEAEQS